MADNLQARGLSMDAPRQQGGSQATAVQTGPVKAISALLNAPARDRDADHKMNPGLFLLAILACLSNAPVATTNEGKADLPTTDRRLDIKAKGKTRRFLCDNSPSSRGALAKHCDSKHPADTSFSWPLPASATV